MDTNPLRWLWDKTGVYSDRVIGFFLAQWKSVLFTSGLALILEHLGLMQVLIKFSWLVVSSLASQGPVAPVAFTPGMPAVLLLDDSAFISRYAEKSPLDRCVLGADLERILAKSPRVVAIDFDLSPLVRANEGERQCQERLDSLLDREAARLLLLVPFPGATPDLLRVKHDWMQARCQAGVRFADGTIEQSMGLVTEQVIGESPAAGARFADQLHAGLSDHVCQSMGPAGGAAALNPWLLPRPDRPVVSGQDAPINFPEAIRSLAVLSLDSAEFGSLASLAGSAVVFGGSWGQDDHFLTAIGSLPGAVLHGLRTVNLAHPVRPLHPVLGLLADIGIALCFAWVVQLFWDRYVKARRIDMALAADGLASGLSTFVMFMFVAIYAALVLLFFLAAQYLYSTWSVLIAPLLIALGILVDGFVTGPVDRMNDLLDDSHRAQGRAAEELQPVESAKKSAIAEVLLLLKWSGALLVVLGVLFWGAWVDLRFFAGWGLLLGEVALYGLVLRYLLCGRFLDRGKANDQSQPPAQGAASCGSAGAPSLYLDPPASEPVRHLALGLAIGRTCVFWLLLLWAASVLLNP